MGAWLGGLLGGSVLGCSLVVVLVIVLVSPPTAMALRQTPTTTTSGCVTCVNPGANAVAASALAIAAHLTQCRQPSDPPGYTWDKCYDAGMPAGAVQYWGAVCPVGTACWPWWQSGALQCVEFVTGAYALAGDELPRAGNAIDFWGLYQGVAGWAEIAVQDAYRGDTPRGWPQAGDLIVWYEAASPLLGHIAVIVQVQLPANGQAGSITYAQANGPAPVQTTLLATDGQVAAYPGSFVVGYIRHVAGH